MLQVVEILPHEKQGPVYSAWSIMWLLMFWWHKEAGHQHARFWQSSTGIYLVVFLSCCRVNSVSTKWWWCIICMLLVNLWKYCFLKWLYHHIYIYNINAEWYGNDTTCETMQHTAVYIRVSAAKMVSMLPKWFYVYLMRGFSYNWRMISCIYHAVWGVFCTYKL